MIIPTINPENLVRILLDQPWHSRCEIIRDYMPKHPGKDTQPTVVVRHNNGTEYPAYLRYSAGPKQGFFWDIYGDDMQCVELAVVALSRAPYPHDVGPLVVSFPLGKSKEG